MPAVHPCSLLLLAILSAAAFPPALAEQVTGTSGHGWAADTMPSFAAAPADEEPAAPLVPADEGVQAAVAAVLVAALAQRFADPMLEVRLESAGVESEGPRDHVVHGRGLLGFGGGDWLAFRYRARYDAASGSAGWPEVELGGGGAADGERFVPNDAGLLAELESLVLAEFAAWPGAGRVVLQLDEVHSLRSGDRFVHIDARGIADFGPGGRTAARIEALYDLRHATWLDIEPELAPNVGPRDDGGTAGY